MGGLLDLKSFTNNNVDGRCIKWAMTILFHILPDAFLSAKGFLSLLFMLYQQGESQADLKSLWSLTNLTFRLECANLYMPLSKSNQQGYSLLFFETLVRLD